MTTPPTAAISYLSSSIYYRHSGRFDAGRTLITLIAGTVVALVCGGIYAYIVRYMPIVGWITFIITGGTGFALGSAMGKLLQWARVRNTTLGLAITAEWTWARKPKSIGSLTNWPRRATRFS